MAAETLLPGGGPGADGRGKNYKCFALSNTTLGILMVTINQSILLISLPALFCGINLNPAAVPGQQRSRRDEPVGAQHGWQLPGQRRQDGAVGPVGPGPGHLTAEHHDLMTEHHDLGILGRLAAA